MDPRELLKIAGGPAKLGRLLGLPRQTFYQWTRIPADYVPTLSRELGIPRHELRADLWDRPGDVA